MNDFLDILKKKNRIITLLPCFFGTVVAIYRYKKMNLINLLLYLAIIILFDFSIKLLKEKAENIKRKENEKIKLSILILIFLSLSVALGVILGKRTSRFILVLECLGFVFGTLYYWGPMPISRTPFSELIFAFTKGMILPFIALYIHIFDMKKIVIFISNNYLFMYIDYLLILEILILFLPCVGTMFNIEIANNMCTMREDLKNKKFTLPISIGKRKSYKIYKNIYTYIYLCISIGAMIRVLSPLSIIIAISINHIKTNNKKLRGARIQKEANILAIKNFLIINVLYILVILI